MSTVKQIQVTLPKDLAERLAFIRKFKHRLPDLPQILEQAIQSVVVSSETKLNIQPDTWKSAKSCPACAHGTLLKRVNSRKPDAPSFYGCSRFPECRHTEPMGETEKRNVK